MNRFACFILTNGRADNVKTDKTLRKLGYTGDIYYVIDNEDAQASEYLSKYGDKVIIFDKQKASEDVDAMDNFHDLRAVVYARNQIHGIAKKLGLTYFLELDDDYGSFQYRFIKGKKLKVEEVKDLDSLFSSVIDFLDVSGALTVTFAQGGDFIGGVESQYKKRLIRKAMNTFFCRVDRPFKFSGNINEDTTMYCDYGRRGKLVFTITDVMITQKQTQSNEGGLSTIYLDNGTYVKSFYTVMNSPSSVKVALMGDKHYRLHHSIDWNSTIPKIINEYWRKE